MPSLGSLPGRAPAWVGRYPPRDDSFFFLVIALNVTKVNYFRSSHFFGELDQRWVLHGMLVERSGNALQLGLIDQSQHSRSRNHMLTTGSVEFTEEVFHVPFNGFFTDNHGPRNFLVAHVATEQREDFALLSG